jgi:Transposase DDE domain group 1
LVQTTASRPKITVTADGRGVASHAGSRLLADLADRSGLTEALGDALAGLRSRRSGHDPGRVLVNVAVMLADGGVAISDLAVLRDQPELFGPVASAATAWRVLDAVDQRLLEAVRLARARARGRLWAQRAEVGRHLPESTAGGRSWPGLVVDLDAMLVDCHSDKELAAPTFKGGFGFHPLLAWLDNTHEALAGRLRPGNAGANTAADHIAVLDDALAQIPDEYRHGVPLLVRADGAGATREFLTHIRSLPEQGVQAEFSVGFTMTETVHHAITRVPTRVWASAIESDGDPRDGAEVAELTGLLPDLTAAGWPAGMRVIVRRERPHPGAQLSLFEHHDGWRYQAFATDTGRGQLADLEARHRAPRSG